MSGTPYEHEADIDDFDGSGTIRPQSSDEIDDEG